MMEKHKGSFELLFGVLDRLVGSDDSRAFKVFLSLVIVIGVFMIYKGHIIKDYFVESKYETYLENELINLETNLPNVSNQALQIVKLSSGADLVLFNRYKPKESRTFYDIFSYEGTFPSEINFSSVENNNPINKTTAEYNNHLAGLPYSDDDGDSSFMPFSLDEDSVAFSCPVFDLNNLYAGSIVMVWYGAKELDLKMTSLEKNSSDEKLFSICNHGSRIIGRSMK